MKNKDAFIIPVGELASSYPLTASERTKISEIERLMRENEVRHIPILRDQSVVGILSDRDIRVVASLTAEQKDILQAGDIMIREPATVSVADSLEKVASQMVTMKIGSVIVNDEDGRFFGLFTATDALHALVEICRAQRV